MRKPTADAPVVTRTVAATPPPAPAPDRYRVLRTILIGPGQTHEPGAVIEGAGMPFGRARQLVQQGWLLPLADGE